MKPRERCDASGKDIPDPNQEVWERHARLSFDQRKLMPKECLLVVLPLHGALSTDLVWLEINDGFTADAGSYKHDNQCYYLRVPKNWPKGNKNAYFELKTTLPITNWHLRKCLQEPGAVGEKLQWVYSNYGQSASVVRVALLRVQRGEESGAWGCVAVQPATPVHQDRATGKVAWPADVAKPPRGATLREVPPTWLKGAGKAWFDEQVEAQKKEQVKKDAGIDLLLGDARNEAPAPATPPPPPPPQEQPLLDRQKLKLDQICAHVLNVASGTFSKSLCDPKLGFPVDLADNRASSCLSKLGAFYVLGVASADDGLAQQQRRGIVRLNGEVHECKRLNRWNCEAVLKAIGAVVGGDKEGEVRARCVVPSAAELLGRVAFFRAKKKQYLDGKAAFVAAKMNPLDYPLALAWIEPSWVALTDHARAQWL